MKSVVVRNDAKRRRQSSPRTSASNKKTQKACERCRRMKIKCSGELPCEHCAKQSSNCAFKEAEKKVLISERHLQQLESTISTYERERSLNIDHAMIPVESISPASVFNSPTSHLPGSTETVIGLYDVERPIIKGPKSSIPNPLSSSGSFFVTDASGRQRHLGLSSTWSFSIQVRQLLQSTTGNQIPVNLTPIPEGATYEIATIPLKSTSSSVGHMASQTYVTYLATTTIYHFGSTYHFFEQETFMQEIKSFYDGSLLSENFTPLWHVQLLLVIAFGKLLLGRGVSKLGPPGATEFVRAMSMLPEATSLYKDQVQSIGVLCLVSLYLHSADLRTAAHVYIGQAQRLALSIGLHREIPDGIVSPSEREHRRRLWWTVYILDRKLSVNMGCPLSVNDKDVDVALPKAVSNDLPSLSLNLHAKVAAVMGRVMDVAYGLSDSINRAFVVGIQNIFSSMTEMTDDFYGNFELNLAEPEGISRASATLHLLYYQCTILATRPIVFVLVQRRLFSNDILDHNRQISEPVIAILKTCVGAATTIIKILSVLHDQGLIEPFLPFDIEAVFSSAFILILMTVAYPSVHIDPSCITIAETIMNWICSRGNEPAKSRLRELRELQEMVAILKTARRNQSPGEASDRTSDWLWNSLDLDRTAAPSRLNLQSIVLMDQELLDNGILDETIEREWFWAEGDSILF